MDLIDRVRQHLLDTAESCETADNIDALMERLLPALVAHASGEASPKLAGDDLQWLERIQDQFSDNEGYDAPAAVMKRLADLGAVRRTSGSRYTVTSFGMHCLFPEEWPFPLRTHGEYVARANAKLAASCA